MFGGIFKKKDTETDKSVQILTGPMENLQVEAIAKNNETTLLSSYEELDGFKFLKFRVIGPLNVKTNRAGHITFVTDNGSMKVETDNMEIQTYFQKKIGIGITELDIDLEEDLLSMIENQEIKTIEIEVKKNHLTLDMVNQELLKSSLVVVEDEEE